MPETPPRTLTEDEAYAIVADRVKRETADLTTQVTTLTAENADLRTKLDTAEAALVTEKAATATATKAFEDYKTEEAAKRETAKLAEDRIAAIKKANPTLEKDETFFTPERAQRWATMDQPAFDDLLAQFSRFAGAPATDQGKPRETAMSGQPPVDPGTKTESAGRGFLQSVRGG